MTSVYTEKDPDTLGISEELNHGSCQDEELDFSILFEYPLCDEYQTSAQEELDIAHKVLNPSGVPYTHGEVSHYGPKSCNSSTYAEPPDGISGYLGDRYYLDPARQAGPSAVSPRIEITPSHELIHSYGRELNLGHPMNPANTSPRSTLPVPGYESAYREPSCLSPASSNSSTSWHSDTYSPYSPWGSPCVSPNNGQADDLCPRFQHIQTLTSPRTSPGTSPRTSVTEESCLGLNSSSPRPNSRSTSPVGKRTYDEHTNQNTPVAKHRSRSPSPQRFRDDSTPNAFNLHQSPYSSSLADAMNSLNTGSSCSIPSKIVKTNPSYPLYTSVELQQENYLGSGEQDVKRKPGSEQVFLVPPNWTKQLVPGIPFYSIPVASLPSLEWPVPSQVDQYHLQIEVQPKPHHRAHYETEGSRGAVKAPTGGHPVIQLHGYRGKEPLGLHIFIGTADERILKPHAFYQVHRITGKTVTTTSYEKIIGSSKVLEIPLEPKNNMKAIIDCAGILKLRNADIELRKGETDIGRKNTRVRMVFRVHIPQPGGGVVSLQVASTPIECSQRSAHELPMVEKQDVEGCSVLGGQQMILTGQNFTSDSKVVFTEKTHDGQQIWESEASVDKDKSQANMLFVEVPPYRDLSMRHAVKVNFYVINGKRKRSQPQHFTFMPLPVPAIKTEPIDEYEPNLMTAKMSRSLGTLPQPYYHPQGMMTSDSCLIASMASCQQLRSGLSPPDSRYQQQTSAVIYPRSKSLSTSPLLYQQGSLMASPVPPMADGQRSVLVHASSPAQSTIIHQQQSTSPNHHPTSIIQFSPTNHQLRGGGLQEHQRIMYCENYQTSPACSPAPSASQAQRISPSHYPTVIQQQPYVQKMPKNRSSPSQLEEQRSSDNPKDRSGALRVTVKEENLDQLYLDDVNEIIRKDLTAVQGRGQT